MKMQHTLSKLFACFLNAFLVLALLAIVACEPEVNLYGEVIHVKDGDSIVVLDSLNQKHEIRLAYIDAPERFQAYGKQAKKHLADLVLNEQVEIVIIEPTDRYGRTIAEINLEDNFNVNKEMLESGMAWHYDKYPGTAKHEQLERQAQRNKAGLWQEKNPTPPWEFRRK
jgi:micrococcal nuclease